MLQLLKRLLGWETVDYKALLQAGALIIDVRTKEEFAAGHAPKAINIPLQQLHKKVRWIKRQKKPVIVCCASGMRSAQATHYLKNHGIEAYNIGSWRKAAKVCSQVS